tara:strand:- start:817 stop:1251 length:435 start_codon:yes stop_codon:yes gene_type:complete
MSYKGKYSPINVKKYKGDPTKVIYRSLLERRFMVYCDTNSSILQWNSEEVVVPYRSPLDNRIHRYFVDFWIKFRDKNGDIKTNLIEIKPFTQTKEPKRTIKKHTRRFIREVATWGVNQAKWKAADNYCKDRLWEFKIITEKELK